MRSFSNDDFKKMAYFLYKQKEFDNLWPDYKNKLEKGYAMNAVMTKEEARQPFEKYYEEKLISDNMLMPYHDFVDKDTNPVAKTVFANAEYMEELLASPLLIDWYYQVYKDEYAKEENEMIEPEL